VTSQETLRRLALADEHFVEDQAGLGFRPALISALDAKTVGLLQLRTPVVLSPLTARREWTVRGGAGGGRQGGRDRWRAVGHDLAEGLGPSAAKAAALGYDIAATPEKPGGSPTARRIAPMALGRKGWHDCAD